MESEARHPTGRLPPSESVDGHAHIQGTSSKVLPAGSSPSESVHLPPPSLPNTPHCGLCLPSMKGFLERFYERERVCVRVCAGASVRK